MENRTGIFTNMIIWFGVAISVSEIQAGIQIGSAAPIDSIWVPLILGHVIGGIMLYFVGLIGARLRVNAMESSVSSRLEGFSSHSQTVMQCHPIEANARCSSRSRSLFLRIFSTQKSRLVFGILQHSEFLGASIST